MALLGTRDHFTSLGDDGTDEVYRRVYESVLAHQLRPGTKLPEEKLAAIFGVSRAKIRKVIARLEHEQVVEVVHNRGAFVAHPSADQASDTLEARRVIEPAIVQSLAEKASRHDIDALRKHLTSESAAVKRGDKPAYIRLSGEFHNLVAELAWQRRADPHAQGTDGAHQSHHPAVRHRGRLCPAWSTSTR